MDEEFAPLYSTRERAVMVIKLLAVGLPILLIGELWFFDWLGAYARHANCYLYGDITGVHLVWYGVFVLMPLSVAPLVAVLLGPLAWLRSIRVPPVFHRSFRLGRRAGEKADRIDRTLPA